MLHRLAVLLLGLLCCHAILAADVPIYAPAPDWVHASSPDTPAPANDAAIRIVSLDFQFNFDGSGNEVYSSEKIRIQTPQGLGTAGTVTLPWNPETDTLTIHKVVIHRGDQAIDVLASGQKFTVLRRENKLEYAMLDGVLTAVIQPPGLQLGDVLEVAFTLKHSDPVLHGVNEMLDSSFPPFPIANLNIRARWPTASNIRWQASTQLKGLVKSQEGDHTVLSLVAKDFQPPTAAKFAPVRFQMGNQLEFSGLQSWTDVSQRMAPLYSRAEKLDTQSPLHAEIDRIRNGSPDAASRALAALRLVQDQVRYVYLGMNDGGLIPATADETWNRRFGDCKGKTVLLLALLHGVGIDAEPVVVNTKIGDSIKTRLPLVELFDHVLVRATIGGKTYWLDGTRSGDRALEKLVVPYYHWGLPLTGHATDLVAMVPEPLSEPQATLNVRIDATAGIDKPAPIHAETVYTADLAQTIKAPLANLTPDNLDNALHAFWAKVFPYAQVKSATASFDDKTGVETLTMDGSATLEWRQNQFRVDSVQLGYEADFTREPQPDHDVPFMVGFPTYVRSTETILLPDEGRGFSLHGTDIEQTVAGTRFRRQATLKAGVFSAQAEGVAVMPEFPAAEAESAQKSLREMVRNVVFITAPARNAAVPALPRISPIYAKSRDDHLQAGLSLAEKGELEQAVNEFTQVLLIAPLDGIAMQNRGSAYLRMQKLGLARADLEVALELNPMSPDVLRQLAYLDAVQGHPDAAVEHLKTLLSIDPSSADTLSRLAFAYMAQGKYDLALTDLEAALRNKPDNYTPYGPRATIFRIQGHPDLALAEARAAMDVGDRETSDKKAQAYAMAGQIYARSGDWSDSVHAFDQAVAVKPDLNLLLARGHFRQLSDTAGRRADIEAALALDPKSEVARASLAEVQVAAGDYIGAVATLTSLLEDDANSPELLNRRGIAYMKSGQPQLAEADFTRAQQLVKAAPVLNNMCWALATANIELQRSLSECDAADSMTPGVFATLDSRAFVLLRMGRLKDALAVYDLALKIEPLSQSSLYGRGITRRRMGDSGGDADLQLARAVDGLIEDQFKSYGITP